MAIRVGVDGLSARAKTSWASSAHLPYLQASGGRYAITALCNFCVSTAQSAIEAYSLPARAEELDALAKENNARTMIGLQGELSPLILKVKSLIEQENKIGKVLSSSIIAAGGTRTRDSIVEGLRYFTRRIVGGNIITIGLRHMIDFVMLVLGELSAFRSPLNIQRPQVPIMGSDGTVIESVATDVADHIMLLGLLSSGAPLSVTFRRGPPFKGTPGFIWSIHGEKGEIRITATGPALQANDVETKLTLHTFDQEEVEVIEWDRHFKDPPRPARNVAAMYEAFANRETEKYPDCTHAVLRHRQIEEVFKSAEEGRRGVYLG